jgi:hypothetical protein
MRICVQANARFAVSGKIFPVMDLLNHNPEAGQCAPSPALCCACEGFLAVCCKGCMHAADMCMQQLCRIWHTPGSVMAPAVHFVASMRKNKAKALAAGKLLHDAPNVL